MRDTQVVFKNIDTGDSIRSYASHVIKQIVEKAPYDSNGLALVEKNESGYLCSLDIYSKSGPFIGRGFSPEPARALEALQSDLEAKILRKF